MGHSTVFPNFSYLANGTVRVWLPRGPNQIEVWAWVASPVAAPPEVKEDFRKSVLRTFSPGGLLEQDDGENWNEIQKVLRGHIARQNRFNMQMGVGHAGQDVDGLPGRTNYVYSEEAARGMYYRWAEMVTGMTWSEMAQREQVRADADQPVSAGSLTGLGHPG
jgi:hypothetical protein